MSPSLLAEQQPLCPDLTPNADQDLLRNRISPQKQKQTHSLIQKTKGGESVPETEAEAETPSVSLQKLKQMKPLLQEGKVYDQFFWDNSTEPHATRRKEMLKKYPEIRKLMRPEPLTKYVVIAQVGFQLACAWFFKDSSLSNPFFWLSAYVIGGTVSAGLLLAVHEVSHFLAFKSFLANKVLGCIANIPIVLPFCADFKVCHFPLKGDLCIC
jgi:hypothetical protein